MKDDIIVKFLESNNELSELIHKNRFRKIKSTILKSIFLLVVAIIIPLVFEFKTFGFVISISLAIVTSIICFKPYKFVNDGTLVGIIESINHDYRLDTKKGTKGFSQSHVYTSIKQTHDILITFSRKEEEKEKYKIACSAQYEKIFKPGDKIVYNPYLPYPANLTNITKCVCMNCGTMQNSDNTNCYNCKNILLNKKTMK